VVRRLSRSRYSAELREVEQVIAAVDRKQGKTKTSQETTMLARMLYSPRALNRAFAKAFELCGWEKHKEQCDYPTQYYVPDNVPNSPAKGDFREMDFGKNRVGVEVQFGK
jgi:hypothetical protein